MGKSSKIFQSQEGKCHCQAATQDYTETFLFLNYLTTIFHCARCAFSNRRMPLNDALQIMYLQHTSESFISGFAGRSNESFFKKYILRSINTRTTILFKNLQCY